MYLPMPPARTSLANFFSPLVNNFEQMYLTGKETYPLERTLLTTGLTAAGVESLFRQQIRYETPHLAIRVSARRRPRPSGERRRMKRIAIVATVYRYLSHAQHIGDRFLVGYPRDGTLAQAGHEGRVALRRPEAGRRPERRAREGVRFSPSTRRSREALRCGGSKLAVDAVLVIGEHGEYPRNDKGQVLYPRYDFVKQCVEVFEKDGVAVPLYNDKHLSYSFEQAKWMVDASRRLKFPMLAGSSLPVTWRLPDIELPLNCEIESALVVGYGGRGRDGLPRPRGAAVHGRAAQGRRDRRQGGADDRRGRGLEGG